MNRDVRTEVELPPLNVVRRPLAGPDRPWTRRRFLLGAGALLGGALVGCADDDTDSASPSSPATTDTASATPTQEPSAAAGFPKTVFHAVGSTRIEEAPERIVAATDGAELAALLALGVKPIGFGQRNDPLRPWIAEAGGDDAAIQKYELTEETNFEALAAWNPDIIIGQVGFVTVENIDEYDAIAPTVATSFVGWRESLRQVANAVGASDRAEEIIAELDAEIAAMGERLAGTTVRTRWLFGFPGYLGRLNDRSPIGALLTEMNLPGLPKQIAAGEAVDEIATENLGKELEEADAVVVLEFEEPAGAGEKTLRENPLFERAEAVAEDQLIALAVDESNAAYFDSVLTVRRNLELIERVFSELE